MPVKPWTRIRDAGHYGATCAQIDATWNHTAAAAGKEDLLFLNVWTPEWPSRSKKPVMVWIHGGGNMGGSALGAGGIELPFNGESLSRHGVVIITIQYRLGRLGFLSHLDLTAGSPNQTSGNYARLDCIAALHWVNRNIGNFGCDSANVSIFGQSAGGNNVGMMLVSSLSKGLFARATEESGTVVSRRFASRHPSSSTRVEKSLAHAGSCVGSTQYRITRPAKHPLTTVQGRGRFARAGLFRVTTIGQAFHWVERDEVPETFDPHSRRRRTGAREPRQAASTGELGTVSRSYRRKIPWTANRSALGDSSSRFAANAEPGTSFAGSGGNGGRMDARARGSRRLE